MNNGNRLNCSVGIMAYNEAANIENLLEALLHQQEKEACIREIVVVASGCTDDTIPIVENWRKIDPRIRLLVQRRREGKTSAMNMFIERATSEILVLEGADTVPLPTTIDQLVGPFNNSDIGMTGGHPIPVNGRNTFIGFAGHLIWVLHHHLSLRYPKCGELVAWRNCLPSIPPTVSDEATIEALIVSKGLRLAYAPEAIVYMCAPSTAPDFVRQRRRIWAGYLLMKRERSYRVSTLYTSRVWRSLLATTDWNLRSVSWTLGAVVLEQYARFLGTLDVLIWNKDHVIWDVVESTKSLQHGTQ